MHPLLFAVILSILYLAKSWNFHAIRHELFNYSAQLQYIPTEMTLQNLPIIEDTISSFLKKNLLSVQPQVESFMIQVLGFSPLGLFVFLSFVQLAIGACGCYWIGKGLCKSRWGGAYVMAFSLWGWAHFCTMGYLLHWELGMFPGSVGISLVFFGMGLWFLNHRASPFIVLGLLFNFHPSNAFILAVFLVADIILMVWKGTLTSSVRRKLYMGMALGFLLALPELYLIKQAKMPAMPEGMTDLWWRWIELRSSYHVFPWRQLYQVYQLALLAGIILSVLWILSKKKIVGSETVGKILAPSIGVFLLIFCTWTGVEFFHSVTIGTMNLTRANLFLVPIAGALIFLLARTLIERPDPFNALLGFSILFANFLPLKTPRLWIFPAALYLFGCFSVWRLPSELRSHAPPQRRLFGYYVFGVYLILFALFNEHTFRVHMKKEITSDWRPLAALKEWGVQNTPRDSVFLVPPHLTCAAACLGRTPLLVGHDIGISVYFRNALPLEQKMLRSVFKLDISDIERAKTLRLDISRYFSETYEKLDLDDIKRIKADFPRITHVVTFHEHSLELPVLYQNERYNVYAVSDSISSSKKPPT